MNSNVNGLFPVSEALEKGTIFQELYKPYKNFVYKISKEKLIDESYELKSYILAMYDLKLYLDIHPSNTEIKKLFESYKAKAEQIKNDPRGRYYV